MAAATWLGIALCLSQSALFSGCNLAFYRLSRLQLEVESGRNARARRILNLRRDSNFLLATILWGNVAINVLLALLANSVLFGLYAFLFSTVVITWFGEVMPQAYFARHPLRTAGTLAPLVRCYQILLYPVARPTALFLDWWIGQEAIEYFHEPQLRAILKAHVHSPETEVGDVEGLGALNFLDIDDLATSRAGEPLSEESVIRLPMEAGRPRFPAMTRSADDPFLRLLNAAGMRWVIVVDDAGEPQLAIDVASFTRGALYGGDAFEPYEHCHYPVIVRNRNTTLGEVISRLKRFTAPGAGTIENDVVLVWLETPRIITGADILGRLLAGIGRDSRNQP
ncbi:MAG: DUF21 domain-containing protein [Gammaproteobacteria bacterium]|nr:DUF21 domain-containing protein [Gammaproteobacteria bacterium]